MTSKTQTQETFNSFSSFHQDEVMERVEETRRNSPDTFDFDTEFEYEVEMESCTVEMENRSFDREQEDFRRSCYDFDYQPD